MTTINYNIWGSLPLLKQINEEIRIKQPNRIIVYGLEEHEISEHYATPYYNATLKDVDELNYLIKLYNIEVILIFGSSGGEKHYQIHPFISKFPNKIIQWPLYWLYRSHQELSRRNNLTLRPMGDIKKLYMSLNNKTHYHRCLLMDKLSENNLIDYGYISWIEPNRINYKWNHWQEKQMIIDTEYPLHLDSFTCFPKEYKEVLVNVIPESTVNVPFITEKTFTAILHKQPFLILGAEKIHNVLLENGFELYDEVFDYSFDNYSSTEDRINAIIKNLLKVKNQDYLQLRKIMEEKIERNYKNAIEIITDKNWIPIEIKKLIEDTHDMTRFGISDGYFK